MIAVIDYGMGNLGSVAKAFMAIGAKVRITSSPKDLIKAQKIVLPGVGAFSYTMSSLKQLGLEASLIENIEDGKPYLGLCLGLQTLFQESEEGSKRKGLGLVKGSVKRFKNTNLKVPHMGWNQIKVKNTKCPLLKNIPDGSWMYFVHSYYVIPKDKKLIATDTDYGIKFASMIWKDNVYATQFHPEKSQTLGMRMLENIVKL